MSDSPPDVLLILEDATDQFVADLPKDCYTRISPDLLQFLRENHDKTPAFVVFLDSKCDPKQLPRIVGPVVRGEFPACVGSRRMRKQPPGTVPLLTTLFNSMACLLIRLTTGKVYTDISPFRAMTWQTLQTTSPHPLPMQFKAPRARLKVLEVPIDYKR